MKQFIFGHPLATHTIGKEIFKKVDSFIKDHQLSRIHSINA